MRKTALLGLPIYDKPSEDKFKLNDWNTANEKMDKAYERVINIGDNITTVNANVEIIEARQGEVTLGANINKISSQLEHTTNKENWVSVLDFGAKCDGIADDSVAFQNAINAVNVVTTLKGQWKRAIYVPSKMRITQKIFANQGQFKLEGNSLSNSLIVFEGENSGIEIGNDTKQAFEVELSNITFKGDDTNKDLLIFKNIINLYFDRFHITNWGKNNYGIKMYKCQIMFFDKCVIEGGSDLIKNPGDRHGIYIDNMSSIFNFTNGNAWNLDKFITFNGTTQNINIKDNWIECVRSVVGFNCVDDMRFLNLKFKGNTVNIHNEGGIIYSEFAFIDVVSTETTNLYSSVFDVCENTIYLWDITNIKGNSMVNIPTLLSGGVVTILFDNNIFSGKTLTELNAYVVKCATESMANNVMIQSCAMTRTSEYQNITNFKNSLVGFTISQNRTVTAPKGIYLAPYQALNTGNIEYSNGNFYGGYNGVIRELPKFSGATIPVSTATDIGTLRTEYNNLVSALKSAKIIN